MGQKWSASKGKFSLQYAEYSVTGRRSEMEDAFIADLQFGKSYPKQAKAKGTLPPCPDLPSPNIKIRARTGNAQRRPVWSVRRSFWSEVFSICGFEPSTARSRRGEAWHSNCR